MEVIFTGEWIKTSSISVVESQVYGTGGGNSERDNETILTKEEKRGCAEDGEMVYIK